MKERLIEVYRKIYRVKVFRPIAFLIYCVGLTKWFNDIVDWLDVKVFHNDFKESKAYFQKNRKRLLNNVNALADERSKKVYKALVNYRMTHERKYMRGIVDPFKDMYFDKDIVKWEDAEVFCECGAYDGDTLKVISDLMKINGINNWRALAFECEDNNYKLLTNRIRKDKSLNGRVHPIKLATWSKKSELHFDSGMEQSSRMSKSGDMVVKADSVDNVLERLESSVWDYGDSNIAYNKSENPFWGGITFIIMDVEGAEIPSLKGAFQTITKNRPRLAISIYHSNSDFVDIIEYIHRNWPFYKLYVRHYTWLYTETVLYAIP